MQLSQLQELFRQHEQSVLLSTDVRWADKTNYWQQISTFKEPVMWVIHPATKCFYKVTAKHLPKWLLKFHCPDGFKTMPLILTHLGGRSMEFVFLMVEKVWTVQTERTLDKFLARAATPRFAKKPSKQESTLWQVYSLRNTVHDIRWLLYDQTGATHKDLLRKFQTTLKRMRRNPPKYFTEAHKAAVLRLLDGDLIFTEGNSELLVLRQISTQQIDSHKLVENMRHNTRQLAQIAGVAHYERHVDMSAVALGKLKKARPAFLLD